MDLVAERAGLLNKAGSFYREILAEAEVQKAGQLAQLVCNTRVFRQISNVKDAVLSGGYFTDHWKVIRFKDEQILYYGTDRALQKRYRIPYENGAAISRPGFLTIYRHFLPAVETATDLTVTRIDTADGEVYLDGAGYHVSALELADGATVTATDNNLDITVLATADDTLVTTETTTENGLSEYQLPLLFPGGESDVVYGDDSQLVYGVLIPKDIFVHIIELEDGSCLHAGFDFESRYGLINFRENPVKVLGGMKFMARAYTERRRNLYSYVLGVDDVYGPVDRIMEYYRRNQSPHSLYLAAAQAIGMAVIRENCTILNVVPLHGGKAYLTDKGRYDAPYPHTWLPIGTQLKEGYVIGGAELFRIYGPHEPLPVGLPGIELREACPVPGLTAPNSVVQLYVDGVFQPAYSGKDAAVQAYWDYLKEMPAPTGDTPATGNAMYHLLNSIVGHKYILVRVNESSMPGKMQLQLYEFLREQRPLGSVLLYAPITRRIVETE